MQNKVLSLVFTSVLMTNFSVNAQSLDKSRDAIPAKELQAKTRAEALKEVKNSQSLGGVATGGGNRLQNRTVGTDIAEKINRSKPATKYVLRGIEAKIASIQYAPQDPLMTEQKKKQMEDLGKKLFGGKVTIYDALEKAVLQPQSAGPCFDNGGTAVDASAKDAPTICFSVERLSNLPADIADQEIIALVAHEISHMLGTDESEATFFQSLVSANLTVDAIDRIPLAAEAYSNDVRSIIGSVQDLKNLADQGDKESVCKRVSGFYTGISGFTYKTRVASYSQGAAFVNHNEMKDIMGVMAKTINIAGYCFSPTSKFYNFNETFQGRSEMSLKEFYKIMSTQVAPGMAVPNWKVRNIEMSSDALSLELNDIIKALTAARGKI